jgi:hypothetical protein
MGIVNRRIMVPTGIGINGIHLFEKYLKAKKPRGMAQVLGACLASARPKSKPQDCHEKKRIGRKGLWFL